VATAIIAETWLFAYKSITDPPFRLAFEKPPLPRGLAVAARWSGISMAISMGSMQAGITQSIGRKPVIVVDPDGLDAAPHWCLEALGR
jgi:hypothetical protein